MNISRPKRYKPEYIDYGLLLLFTLLSWWQVSHPSYCLKWDNLDIYMPWKHYVTECVRNGILPLWNPFMNCGFPQMGEPGTWYPVSWIIGLLMRYDMLALKIEFLVHVFGAGVGMYLWSGTFSGSRKIRLASAISYLSSGFFVSNAQHLGWLVAACWFPFILNFLHRIFQEYHLSLCIKLSFCSFMLLTGGYPGILFVALYIFSGYILYKIYLLVRKKENKQLIRGVKQLSISLLFTLMLSCVVLLASSDLKPNINRGAGLSSDFNKGTKSVCSGYLTPRSLITFVFPAAAAAPKETFWGQDFSLINCYIGLVPLLLIIFALSKLRQLHFIHLFVAFAALFLIIALAKDFPLRSWMADYLPLMNLFRLPSLFRLFSIFFLILAFVQASTFVVSLNDHRQQFSKYLLYASLLLVLVGIIDLFYIQKWMFRKLFTEGFHCFDSIAGIPERIFLQASIMFIIIMSARYLVRTTKIPFFSVISLAIAFDLLLSIQLNMNATVVDHRDTRSTNRAIAEKPHAYPKPSLDILFSEFDDKKLGLEIPNLWRNLAIFSKKPSCEGHSPISLNINNEAQLYSEYKSTIDHPLLYLKNGKKQEQSNILIRSFSPNAIECMVSLSKEDELVYLQNYYPYWTVTVDQKKQKIQLTDRTFLAIPLDKGNHVVRFQFEPTTIIAAFYLSLISFIAGLAFLIFNAIKNTYLSWPF